MLWSKSLFTVSCRLLGEEQNGANQYLSIYLRTLRLSMIRLIPLDGPMDHVVDGRGKEGNYPLLIFANTEVKEQKMKSWGGSMRTAGSFLILTTWPWRRFDNKILSFWIMIPGRDTCTGSHMIFKNKSRRDCFMSHVKHALIMQHLSR